MVGFLLITHLHSLVSLDFQKLYFTSRGSRWAFHRKWKNPVSDLREGWPEHCLNHYIDLIVSVLTFFLNKVAIFFTSEIACYKFVCVFVK